MCVHCRHELAALDLVPVLSWLWLRGRCHYCRKPISRQYPLVELTTAFLFAISYVYWPYLLHTPLSILHFALWLVILIGFMALLVYDLRWMILPNKLIAFLLGTSLVQLLVKLLAVSDKLSVLTAATWGILIIFGLFYGLFTVSKGRWIGGGDVKLGLVLGILVGGPLNAIGLIFLASLSGSLVGLGLIIAKNTNLRTKIPFGPFLILATIFVYLFASVLTTWLHSRLLYL